jgi:hypothetical protein
MLLVFYLKLLKPDLINELYNFKNKHIENNLNKNFVKFKFSDELKK